MLDFIFPPLCLSCKEKCETMHLCPACWELCAPPDPADRCRHCFCDLEEKGGMCAQCRREPFLPIPRAYVFDRQAPAKLLGMEAMEALAGFAVNQWTRLEWALPDAVIPMPDADSKKFAKAFAAILGRPVSKALYGAGDRIALEPDSIQEDEELLLIGVSNPIRRLQNAVFSLSESFPKRIYLLSLFPYALSFP